MLDIRWICLTNGRHQNNTVKVTVSNTFIFWFILSILSFMMVVYVDFSKHPPNLYNPQITRGFKRIVKQLNKTFYIESEGLK